MPDKLLYRDFKAVHTYLKARLDQGDLKAVSLDVFDTLLARTSTPERIQRHVCRLLAERLKHIYSTEEVLLARQVAEESLRQQSYQQGLDHECRFSEWAPVWAGRLLPEQSEVLAQEIIELELNLESLALYVKKDVTPFLRWLVQQPIKLLAISDMYLDGIYVQRLLEKLGIAHYFDDIVVSSDSGLGKYSGRLYQQVQHEHALNPQQWVHIGDNVHSDRKMACQLGIQGIWLYQPEDLERIEQQKINQTMAEQGGSWVGRHFFTQVQERMQRDQTYVEHEQDIYFRYGCEVLGPAFSSFVQGLQERLLARPVDKVFFIARDGYLFQEMYRQLSDALPLQYLCLSRKVISAAAVAEGMTLQQAQVAFYNPKQAGLASLCKVYSLNESSLRPLAEQYGFTDFTAPITDWQDERLCQWLEDEQVQMLIREQGQKHRDDLIGYLHQEGFFSHSSVAMVDIGWNGTVQHFLQKTFADDATFPELQGYYFAFVPKLHSDEQLLQTAEGIVHDSRRLNACERIVAEFEEVFEQGARALHGTTIAYQQSLNGGYEAVFKPDQARDRQAELLANPLVSRLQQGIMTHWKHFRAVQALNAYSSHCLLAYVQGVLERAVVYPTKEEVNALSHLVHTEDFGHDHILAMGKSRLTWQQLFRPKQFIQQLKQDAWRYAALCQLPGGLANFTMRMVYLHSIKK